MTYAEYVEWHQGLIEKLLKSPERSGDIQASLKEFLASINASIDAYAHAIDSVSKTLSHLNNSTAQLCVMRNTIQKEIARYAKQTT